MQEFIVGIIICCCLLLIIRRIIQYFKQIKRKENPCKGCCGCDISKKRQENCIKKG